MKFKTNVSLVYRVVMGVSLVLSVGMKESTLLVLPNQVPTLYYFYIQYEFITIFELKPYETSIYLGILWQ